LAKGREALTEKRLAVERMIDGLRFTTITDVTALHTVEGALAVPTKTRCHNHRVKRS
jgi:hypothetical protein